MNKKILLILAIFILTSLIAPDAFARRVKDDPLLTEVIRKLSSDEEIVFWEDVPLSVQRQLLERVAGELNIDITRITRDTLVKHFNFIKGKTLGGIYTYYSNLLKKAREDPDVLPADIRTKIPLEDISIINTMQFMFKILDISTERAEFTIEEVIDILSSDERHMRWDYVPFEVQQQLLVKAAGELGIDITMFEAHHFLTEFSFLKHHTLEVMYKYYRRILMEAREDFNSLSQKFKNRVDEQEIGDLNTMQFMRKILRFPYYVTRSIGERIHLYRYRIGLTQEELAKRIGLQDASVIDDLEQGKDYPEMRFLELLADTMCIDVHLLVTGKTDPYNYTAEEKIWIADSAKSLNDWQWRKIAEENPRQIAFYVRELAIYIALLEGTFRDIWDLSGNPRYFRDVTVPCLGRTLIALARAFDGVYPILKFLETKGLIESINEEVRERLK